jgi:predicted ribosome quality control (RQC) complex YloA/Tae2 family protein
MDNKRFREFVSPSGCRVIVGKNDRANDELTFDIADPDDLWFHIAAIPGPHVVLKCGTIIENEDIHFAARLAVQYSKAKTSGKVDYCHIKHLKRTKTPGLVIMSKSTSIKIHISTCV